VTVRLLQKPPVARGLLLGFASVAAGARCVGAISRAASSGRTNDGQGDDPCRRALQPAAIRSTAALVIVEPDGPQASRSSRRRRAGYRARGRATTIRASTSEAERLQFWADAERLSAVSCIAPDYLCMDLHDPAGARLPEALVGMDRPPEQG
jgi:glycolate oxidase